MPMKEEEKQVMQDMLGSVHDSFKDVVRSSRKGRLTGPEDELFSGRAWTGRQARCCLSV